MRKESGYYPPGAEFDLRAPYNQPDDDDEYPSNDYDGQEPDDDYDERKLREFNHEQQPR